MPQGIASNKDGINPAASRASIIIIHLPAIISLKEDTEIIKHNKQIPNKFPNQILINSNGVIAQVVNNPAFPVNNLNLNKITDINPIENIQAPAKPPIYKYNIQPNPIITPAKILIFSPQYYNTIFLCQMQHNFIFIKNYYIIYIES